MTSEVVKLAFCQHLSAQSAQSITPTIIVSTEVTTSKPILEPSESQVPTSQLEVIKVEHEQVKAPTREVRATPSNRAKRKSMPTYPLAKRSQANKGKQPEVAKRKVKPQARAQSEVKPGGIYLDAILDNLSAILGNFARSLKKEGLRNDFLFGYLARHGLLVISNTFAFLLPYIKY